MPDKLFNDAQQLRFVLKTAKMGLWRLEEGKGARRLLVDDLARELLGLDEDLTPEETYGFWLANVGEDFRESTERHIQEIYSLGKSEETYTYKCPGREERLLRAGGYIASSGSWRAGAIGYVQDISEGCECARECAKDFGIDALTGAYENRKFMELAAQRLAEEPEGRYSMVYLDIEKFRLINDQLGSEAGNQVLAALAARIQSYCTDDEVFGRLEADDFVVLTHDGEKLYENIKSLHGAVVDMVQGAQVTLKCGIYDISDPSLEIRAMCDRAKLACDSVKGKYGATYAHYDDNMLRKLIDRQFVMDNFQQAIDERQFVVYYQPVYGIASRKIKYSEALVRWKHPEKGLIPPGEFIPVCEETGAITELDLYVLEAVCRDMDYCRNTGEPYGAVNINLSREDFFGGDIYGEIISRINKYGIEPSKINLEITESAYRTDSAQINNITRRFKAAGFSIVMDDFGSAYSTFNTLKDIDFDVLKIDMAFFENFDISPKAGVIVSHIISMSKDMDLQVVAEGVENERELRFLERAGCDCAQGYYFAKPMSGPEFRAMALKTGGFEDSAGAIEPLAAPESTARGPGLEAGFYRELLDDSGRTVIVCDSRTREVLYANKRAETMYAAADGNYRGKTCHEYLWGRREPCENCCVQQLRAGSPEAAMEFATDDGKYLSAMCRRSNLMERDVVAAYIDDVTEQKLASVAMEETRQRYALALSCSDVSIWEYDIAGKTIHQIEKTGDFREFGNIFENVPESLIESGYIKPEEAEACRELYLRIAAGEKRVSGDFWVLTAPREPRRCQRITYFAVADAQGRPVGAYGAGQDITRLKRIEEAYQDELRRRELIQDSLVAYSLINLTRDEVLDIWAKDVPESHYVYSTDCRQGFMGFLCENGLTDEQNERFSVPSLLDSFSKNETKLTERFPCVPPDGSSAWEECTVNLLQQPDTGDVLAFFYSRDVTDEADMKLVINGIIEMEYDAVISISLAWDRFKVHACKDVFSIDRRSAWGRYSEEVHRMCRKGLALEEAKRAWKKLRIESIREGLAESGAYIVELTQNTATGPRRKRFRFNYLDRENDMVLMTIMDIEDIVNAERERQLDIERVNREHSEKLELALLAAQEASAAKSDFLSRMSHEIRTPMNAIIGMTKLARAEPGNPEATADYLKQIDESSDYLLGMISDILDVNRIESGKFELHREWSRPLETVRACVSMMKPLMREKQIDFIYPDLENKSCAYESYLDTMRTRQVLTNLLNNAYKFTPEGGAVELSVKNEFFENGYASDIITVRDTGCGMSPGFLGRFGEPFAQERLEEGSNIPGTGLGVALVKQIVDAAGGAFSVESELHKGTTITVRMPYEYREAGRGPVPENVMETDDLTGASILLVEDHPLNQRIAVSLLSKAGASVYVANNGRVGLEVFENSGKDDIDLILMDVRMPVMNGLDATRAIRACGHPRAASVPIVAMSANAFAEDVEAAKLAGMTDYLTKPVEPSRLYRTVAAAIRESQNALR